MFRKIAMSADLILDKYLGTGVGGGLYYYPIDKKVVKPFLGLYYTRLMGRELEYEKSDNAITSFKVTDANYWVPSIGVRLEIIPDTVVLRHGKSMALFFKCGYKVNTSNTPTVTQTGGVSDGNKFKKIDRYIKDGVVVSIGVFLGIHKKKA
ncbi:MAG: autotransporter outer membrane beta-barrel domain-containing protein [Chitinophagaceae bacterium]